MPCNDTSTIAAEMVRKALAYGATQPKPADAREVAAALATEAVASALALPGSEPPCSTCGGRGWHTAGGNDPAACGRCPAGEAWAAEAQP